MTTIFCFLSGVGIQEIILIVMVLPLFVGIPLVIVFVIIRLSQRKTPVFVSIPTNSPGQTPILKNADKLRELKSLQEKGIISIEEFESEKKKILEL